MRQASEIQVNEKGTSCLPETHALEGNVDTTIVGVGMMASDESFAEVLGFQAAHGRKTRPSIGNSPEPV